MPLRPARSDELAKNIELDPGESLAVRDGAVVIYDQDDAPSWLPPDVDLVAEALASEGEQHYLWPAIRDAILDGRR